jgi:predicted N-acetyltransferase YhbS
VLEVRPARADEFARVGELTLAAYHAIGVGSPEYDRRLRDAERRAREAQLLVALRDGAVAGTITLVGAGSTWREIAQPDEDELRMLAVDPACQGAGVGEALVRACQGARNVVASSAPGMAAAHRLYARLGFARNAARDWSPRPGLPLIVFEWRP